MKNKKKYLALFSSICIFSFSCNLSDSVDDIGHNYVFAHEGQENNVIYNDNDGRLIPCDVVAYNHNNDFIIVKQKPRRECFMEGDKKIKYPNDDSAFYWIVIHENNSILGPLTLEKYEESKLKLKVPPDLRLKPVEIYSIHN